MGRQSLGLSGAGFDLLRVSQVVELGDDDHESSRPSNCCRDFAPDFGASLRSTSITASVDLAFPRYGEGEPWCRNISVARASIRSQGIFGLSVWPGGQFPVPGSSVWRPRSLVAVATRRRAEMEFSLRRLWVKCRRVRCEGRCPLRA